MEPEFKQGCLIVIDPSVSVYSGAFVLANIGEQSQSHDQDEETIEYVFRQVSNITSNQLTLTALQPEHETRVVDKQQVLGVIVQRAGLRRSYSKHYNK